MTELDEIQADYNAGRLEHIKSDLERFIVVHRAQIEALKQELASKLHQPLNDEFAIKQYVLRHRSINPASEIREQLEEIQREKWIRGIQNGHAPDEGQVANEWARLHSAGWRAHRVTTIIFVFDREKERYISLLRDRNPG